jgi:hypothetical protein
MYISLEILFLYLETLLLLKGIYFHRDRERRVKINLDPNSKVYTVNMPTKILKAIKSFH